MSTQNAGHPATPFTITTPFRSLRLLEVPPELLDVITGPSSTACLKFKSTPPLPSSTASASSGPGSGPRDGILHLCADDKVWAVKQVSTSNSVYLIRPAWIETGSEATGGGGDGVDSEMRDADHDNDTDDHDRRILNAAVAGPGATAVAQVGNFLELHPVKIDPGLVERIALDLLPIYDPVSDQTEDVDLRLQAANEAKAPMTLAELLDHVPVPDGIVQKVCAGLCVFESSGLTMATTTTTAAAAAAAAARAAIPSTRALLDVWTAIVETCSIENIDLSGPIDDATQISNLLLRSETSDSAVIAAAVARNLLTCPGGTFHAYNLFDDTQKLKPRETCRFIASLILSSRSRSRSHSPQSLDLKDFVRQWTDLVPASFVKHCQVEDLLSDPSSSEFELVDDGQTIRFKNSPDGSSSSSVATLTTVMMNRHVGSGAAAAAATTTTTTAAGGGSGSGAATAGTKSTATGAAAAAAAGDKKRKWHEKFGAQRNAQAGAGAKR